MNQAFQRKFIAPVDQPGEVPLWLGPALLLSILFFLFMIGYCTIG